MKVAGSRDIVKLSALLDEVCKRYKLFCVDDFADRNLVNFMVSWLESWILVDEEVDLRDLAEDPSAVKVFLSMHGEVFSLARRGLYIYTAIEESQIAKTIRKLKLLASVHKDYHTN